MIHSVGCGYAIQSLISLAGQAPPGTFLLLREIVRGLDVPTQFVGKVFQSLVRVGILESAKGRGGGFALARPKEKISLRQIMEAIDGPRRGELCIFSYPNCDETCPQKLLWSGVRRQVSKLLEKTTLAQLVAAHERKAISNGPKRTRVRTRAARKPSPDGRKPRAARKSRIR